MAQDSNSSVKSVLTSTPWNAVALQHFEKILEAIPAPIRGIAETRVSKKAEALTVEAGRPAITERDLVDALFAETPGGFLGPMKASLEELNIDYAQYGHK